MPAVSESCPRRWPGAGMKWRNITRRKFLLTALLATPAVLAGDGRFVEPTWLDTRRVRLNGGQAGVRFVQFSDVHHKGDHAYLQAVVEKINSLAPDFTCFTG